MIIPSLDTVNVIVEWIAANSIDCSYIYSLHHDEFEFLAIDGQVGGQNEASNGGQLVDSSIIMETRCCQDRSCTCLRYIFMWYYLPYLYNKHYYNTCLCQKPTAISPILSISLNLKIVLFCTKFLLQLSYLHTEHHPHQSLVHIDK